MTKPGTEQLRGGSWSQCMRTSKRGLSMNLPGHRIVGWLGKAALKTHALQTLRDRRASPKRAKRLECVRFIGAFRRARDGPRFMVPIRTEVVAPFATVAWLKTPRTPRAPVAGGKHSPDARQQAIADFARVVLVAGQFRTQKSVLDNGAPKEDSHHARGWQKCPPGTQRDRAAESAAGASQIARMTDELIRPAGNQVVPAFRLDPDYRREKPILRQSPQSQAQ